MFGWVSEGDLKVYLQPELAFCICSNRYITERVTMPSSVSPTPHTEAFSTYSCTPHLVATNTKVQATQEKSHCKGKQSWVAVPGAFFSFSIAYTYAGAGGLQRLVFSGVLLGCFLVFLGVVFLDNSGFVHMTEKAVVYSAVVKP